MFNKKDPHWGGLKKETEQNATALQGQYIVKSLDKCVVVCANLSVEGRGGPKRVKGGLGVWGLGRSRNCVCRLEMGLCNH